MSPTDPDPGPPGQWPSDGQIIRWLLILLAFVTLAFIFYRIIDVLLLAFGAILVAVLLHAIAAPIARLTSLPERWTLFPSLLLVLGVIALAFLLLGAEVRSQLAVIIDTLPGVWRSLANEIGRAPVGRLVLDWAGNNIAGGGAVPGIDRILIALGGASAEILVVLIGGIYLAFQPRLYRGGLLHLLPENRRSLAADTLDASARALRLWLLGQLVIMLIVGTVTGVGLWLIGLPSALALGLIAGLFEFVPFVGPVLAAVPGVLLALAAGPQMALWTLAVYVVVQQAEGYLITPLVQRWAVALPPALTLFALIAIGLLFGILGVILAAPLTVAAYVLVKRLYVREALEEPTALPGDE